MAAVRTYCQRPGLDTRIVDGEAFVITRTTIQHLNPVATLIWLAIETPATHRDITALLCEFYPAVPRRQLSADLSRSLKDLRRMGIVTA
jgi:hypothetical protein